MSLFTAVQRTALASVMSRGLGPGTIVFSYWPSPLLGLGPVVITINAAAARAAGVRFVYIAEALYMTAGARLTCHHYASVWEPAAGPYTGTWYAE